MARRESYIKRDYSSLVKVLVPSGSHSLSPKPPMFLTACSTVSLGQFALIDGVSYVMGGRVGIYDTRCDQLENLTPPHPLLYPNAPPP